MTEKLIEAVNKQINEEFYSAYLYLAMSAAASQVSLEGFANWLMVQAQEERDHAMGLYNHLLERDAPVKLLALAAPDFKFVSAADLLSKSLAHEQHITKCIHELYTMAEAEKDYALRARLEWYVEEQVEEEASVKLLIDRLALAGESGLYHFDKELAGRTYERASILE
jgi:ferritin